MTRILLSFIAALLIMTGLTPGTVRAAGAQDGFNPSASHEIYDFLVHPEGKIMLGGPFVTLDGQSRVGFGQLLSNGKVDPNFDLAIGNGHVKSMVRQPDGKIVLAGGFSTIASEIRYNIGRIDADNSLDNNFNPGANGIIRVLAQQADGKIIVGGDFTELDGQARDSLGRLNPDGSLDGGFQPALDN